MITDAVFFGRSAEKGSVVPCPCSQRWWNMATMCSFSLWLLLLGVGGFLGYISGADQQYMCGVEGGEANGPPLHGVVADGYFSPLQVGDRIVSICGTSTEGMTHTQAVNLLKNAPGSIEMQVRFLSRLFRLWVSWRHMSFDVKTIKWNFLLLFPVSLEHKWLHWEFQEST